MRERPDLFTGPFHVWLVVNKPKAKTLMIRNDRVSGGPILGLAIRLIYRLAMGEQPHRVDFGDGLLYNPHCREVSNPDRDASFLGTQP